MKGSTKLKLACVLTLILFAGILDWKLLLGVAGVWHVFSFAGMIVINSFSNPLSEYKDSNPEIYWTYVLSIFPAIKWMWNATNRLADKYLSD
jgi:hypothetical protein